MSLLPDDADDRILDGGYSCSGKGDAMMWILACLLPFLVPLAVILDDGTPF